MEPIWKGKQTNKTSNTCASDKGKQTNKQAEAARAEAWMQGAVWSCITCGVRYAMHQSTWKSFRDALEMHRRSAEFDTQGHTLTKAWYLVNHSRKSNKLSTPFFPLCISPETASTENCDPRNLL